MALSYFPVFEVNLCKDAEAAYDPGNRIPIHLDQIALPLIDLLDCLWIRRHGFCSSRLNRICAGSCNRCTGTHPSHYLSKDGPPRISLIRCRLVSSSESAPGIPLLWYLIHRGVGDTAHSADEPAIGADN